MSSQISIVQRQMAMISELQEANTAYDLANKELHAKIAKFEVQSICACILENIVTNAVATQPEAPATRPEASATQPEASAKGIMQAVFAAGTVAVLAAGALAVAKNPEAAKDAAVKGCAFVAEKVSSVASFLAEKGRFGLDFLRNSNNVNAVEIDLTKMLKQ
jgi:hypothetical protein